MCVGEADLFRVSHARRIYIPRNKIVRTSAVGLRNYRMFSTYLYNVVL
jgi:hypothetical protein